MAKYRIITLCGSGIASSTICAQKVKKGMADRGIEVEVKPISFREMGGEIGKVDLVVSITPGAKVTINAPVVNGVGLLAGIGEKQILDNIYRILMGGSKS